MLTSSINIVMTSPIDYLVMTSSLTFPWVLRRSTRRLRPVVVSQRPARTRTVTRWALFITYRPYPIGYRMTVRHIDQKSTVLQYLERTATVSNPECHYRIYCTLVFSRFHIEYRNSHFSLQETLVLRSSPLLVKPIDKVGRPSLALPQHHLCITVPPIVTLPFPVSASHDLWLHSGFYRNLQYRNPTVPQFQWCVYCYQVVCSLYEVRGLAPPRVDEGGEWTGHAMMKGPNYEWVRRGTVGILKGVGFFCSFGVHRIPNVLKKQCQSNMSTYWNSFDRKRNTERTIWQWLGVGGCYWSLFPINQYQVPSSGWSLP